MSMHRITLKVNGRTHEIDVASNELLLNVLRNRFYLTGSKYGCGIGECGACTILHGKESVMACMIPAVAADGWEITTVEGLGENGQPSVIQKALVDHGAVQCGFCTPGMAVTSTALLHENPDPDEDFVKNYIRGNFCRCTGYTAIVKAVMESAKILKEKDNK